MLHKVQVRLMISHKLWMALEEKPKLREWRVQMVDNSCHKQGVSQAFQFALNGMFPCPFPPDATYNLFYDFDGFKHLLSPSDLFRASRFDVRVFDPTNDFSFQKQKFVSHLAMDFECTISDVPRHCSAAAPARIGHIKRTNKLV